MTYSNLKRRLCLFSLTMLVASCVFVARESSQRYSQDDCHLSNKKLELQSMMLENNGICPNTQFDEEMAVCLAVFGVIVPVGSFIVSGSVVVVGNVLHWIERKGIC